MRDASVKPSKKRASPALHEKPVRKPAGNLSARRFGARALAIRSYTSRAVLSAAAGNMMKPVAALLLTTLPISTALRPNSRPPPRLRGLRDAASAEPPGGADDLLAQAAALRREANAMQAEYNELAPPPPPEPEPKPKPSEVAGVSPSEVLEWTGSAFAGTIELEQEDGAMRRTPAEWSPWYQGAGKSIAFQRTLSLPLGIILEEGGGGSIRVAEVRPGGSGEQRDIRPGDVLRARLCGNQISGAPRHRYDIVSATASARWRGGSRRSPQQFSLLRIT